MKRSALLALFLISAILANSQELRQRGFYLGAFASPDYSYRNLGSQLPGSARDAFEIPKLSYTAGLDALYQFNERLSLSFGAQLSEKGEKTQYAELTYSAPDPTAPIGVWIDYKEMYLDLPLRVDYYTRIFKRSFFLTGGISTNIFLYENHVMHETYDGGRQEKNSDHRQDGFHRVNPQLQIGAGMDWAFKSSRLKIFPLYRLSLLRVNKGPLDGYFYSFGLGASYLFKL